MIFSVSSNGIECSLDFGPDSVTATVKYLVQDKTIISKEIILADSRLLFSQRQEFLNNHLARVPIIPNLQGNLEIRREVFSSAGAQNMDTSGYREFDLEDIEFQWENPQLEVDAVFRLGIDTLFPQHDLKA